MRCGYRFTELQRMSLEEIVWRVDEERAYEKLVADAMKNG